MNDRRNALQLFRPTPDRGRRSPHRNPYARIPSRRSLLVSRPAPSRAARRRRAALSGLRLRQPQLGRSPRTAGEVALVRAMRRRSHAVRELRSRTEGIGGRSIQRSGAALAGLRAAAAGRDRTRRRSGLAMRRGLSAMLSRAPQLVDGSRPCRGRIRTSIRL